MGVDSLERSTTTLRLPQNVPNDAVQARSVNGPATITARAVAYAKKSPRKRPAKSLAVDETSVGKRVRMKCACGKTIQLRFNKQWYCKGCFNKFHPEAAKAAKQKRSEREVGKKRA